MILRIHNDDLTEGLNIVTRAIATRPAKTSLEGVMIDAAYDKISLTCSDGSMSIVYTTSADISENGQALLPGRLLAELIRKMPSGTTQISTGLQNLAQIRCMKNKSSLSVMNVAEYPEIAKVNQGIEVKVPQKKLKDMLNRVLFAVSTDEQRMILTGCLLEVTHDSLHLVALDGYRMAVQNLSQPFELPEGINLFRAVIPGKVSAELSKILLDDDSFCVLRFDKGRMQCEFANIVFSSVLLAGEYADYQTIIPKAFSTRVMVKKDAVEDAIDRASLMAREGKNNLIRMSFQDQLLRITSNADMGDVDEEIEINLSGNPMDIAFNAKYITELLRSIPGEDMVLKMNSSVSPCVITAKDNDDFLYLILPIRVFQ